MLFRILLDNSSLMERSIVLLEQELASKEMFYYHWPTTFIQNIYVLIGVDSSIDNFKCTLAKPSYTAPNVHFEPRKSGGWFFAVKIWFILSFTSLFPKPNTIILANLNSTFIREYYSWPIIFYWRQSSGSDPMNSSNPVSVDTCFLPATCLLSPNIWL